MKRGGPCAAMLGLAVLAAGTAPAQEVVRWRLEAIYVDVVYADKGVHPPHEEQQRITLEPPPIFKTQGECYQYGGWRMRQHQRLLAAMADHRVTDGRIWCVEDRLPANVG